MVLAARELRCPNQAEVCCPVQGGRDQEFLPRGHQRELRVPARLREHLGELPLQHLPPQPDLVTAC